MSEKTGKFRLTHLLPASIRRGIVSRLMKSFTAKETASRFMETYAAKDGIKVALYDPAIDLLRFPEPHECVGLVHKGIIADAVPWLLKINPYIPEGGVVFDVGGYRGITSQWFSRRARRVFTFEPMPESVDSIRRVIQVRGIENISVHPVALGDKSGIRDFHIYRNKGHNSLGRIDNSEYVGTIQVPTTTLDEFAAQNQVDRIDFLKIDVEGYELEVLQGAGRLLGSKSIGAILFESNPSLLRSLGKAPAPVYELLRSFSYSVTDLDGRPVEVSEVEQSARVDFLARPS